MITGKSNRSAIATLVERASGYTLLVHLPGRHTAEVTTSALIAAFAALPASLCRTLTWDRGTELADHEKVAAATGLEIFFADPHSPWQRGSTENTNGLSRQYFPRAPTSPSTPRNASNRSRTSSTADPANATSGPPPPPSSPRYSRVSSRPLLRRSLESKLSHPLPRRRDGTGTRLVRVIAPALPSDPTAG